MNPTRLPAFVLAASLLACSGGDEPTDPGTPNVPTPPAIATITVSPNPVTIDRLGATVQLSAQARDNSGATVPGVTFEWVSANTDVAVVDSAGRITGVSPGNVEIRAQASGRTGTAAVTVLPVSDEVAACNGGAPVVSLIVEPVLALGIRANLTRFATDICAQGFSAREKLSTFATPPELRAYLADLHTRTSGSLAGVILIGRLPYAYQYVHATSFNPNIPSTDEEAISFQYYADLDGTFSASPTYRSPGNHTHSYDQHTGPVGWEIWVGVLPQYKGNRATTVSALNRYFDKNHSYRTGGPKPPRALLQVSEHFHATTQQQHDLILQDMKTGTYSWVPFSSAPTARLYFDSPPAGLTVQQAYTALTQGVADFTVADAHGFWGASGQITIQWVESNPVKTVFFWSNGCAVGDLDHADNFLSSAIYSPTSDVLVAKGTTNNSGGMGNNQNGFFGRNVATSLSQGRTFGQALLDHVNVPLIYPWSLDREFHFGTAIILGDPTLRLRQ
jgi:hypothetical protein